MQPSMKPQYLHPGSPSEPSGTCWFWKVLPVTAGSAHSADLPMQPAAPHLQIHPRFQVPHAVEQAQKAAAGDTVGVGRHEAPPTCDPTEHPGLVVVQQPRSSNQGHRAVDLKARAQSGSERDRRAAIGRRASGDYPLFPGGVQVPELHVAVSRRDEVAAVLRKRDGQNPAGDLVGGHDGAFLEGGVEGGLVVLCGFPVGSLKPKFHKFSHDSTVLV